MAGTAAGHEAIRATHRKTLELARGAEIGRTATCVVAVGTRIDEDALASLAGNVELTLEAGGLRGSLRGRLNPAFRPGDPLIVRRDPGVTRDAVIVGADGDASTLDRRLVAKLARREAEVTVSISSVGGDAPGALFVDPGPPWRRPRGAEIADRGGFDVDLSSPLADDDDAGRALASLGLGERVLLRASLSDDPRAAALVGAAHRAGHAVLPVSGLAPVAAAVAVAGVPASHICIVSSAAKLTPLARGICRVVTGVRGDRVAGALEGAELGLVALDVGTPREQYLPWRAGSPPAVPGGRSRSAIVVAAAGATADAAEALDPAVAAIASSLLRSGVPTRQLALAVQEATGLSRRAAYEALLALKAQPS
ncbi:MAG: hypothetical protein QOD69_2535 [Solirubrobacteraceae bacterium]|nr:hypothetical protein [Solirubrobacteraceae bacterium]